jgi:hypothetical protein
MGKKSNPHVYFDVALGSQAAGRIVIEVRLHPQLYSHGF